MNHQIIYYNKISKLSSEFEQFKQFEQLLESKFVKLSDEIYGKIRKVEEDVMIQLCQQITDQIISWIDELDNGETLDYKDELSQFMEPWKKYNSYIRSKILGSGNFGQVSLAFSKRNPEAKCRQKSSSNL